MGNWRTILSWDVKPEDYQVGDRVNINRLRVESRGELWYKFADAGWDTSEPVPREATQHMYRLTGVIQSISGDTTVLSEQQQWYYVNFGDQFHTQWDVEAIPFLRDELIPA